MSDVERLFMCLLVIYLLWGHVCSSPLPIFWSGCLFSHWVVELLHIFWTLITYQINALQIFPPILWIVFSLFLDSILWGTKVQNFDEVWFIFFNCLCFWCHTLKNWRIQNVKIFTCAFLSKRFIALALRCSLWSILRWCELVLGDSWPQSSACRCPAFPPRWSENTAQCRKPLPIALNGQPGTLPKVSWLTRGDLCLGSVLFHRSANLSCASTVPQSSLTYKASFRTKYEPCNCSSSSRWFWLFGSLESPYEIQDVFFYFCRRCHWDIDGDSLNL